MKQKIKGDLTTILDSLFQLENLMPNENGYYLALEDENGLNKDFLSKKELNIVKNNILHDITILEKNKNVKTKKVHTPMDPKSLKGVYAIVYISPVLQKMFEETGKLKSNPYDKNSKPLNKYLKNVKNGFVIRNAITKMFNLYLDEVVNNQNDDDKQKINLDGSINSIFKGKESCFFYYLPLSDEEKQSTKKVNRTKILMKDAKKKGLIKKELNTIDTLIKCEKIDDDQSMRRIMSQCLASLNYKTEKNLQEEGSDDLIDAIKSDKIKNKCLEEHDIISKTCALWKAYRLNPDEMPEELL